MPFDKNRYYVDYVLDRIWDLKPTSLVVEEFYGAIPGFRFTAQGPWGAPITFDCVDMFTDQRDHVQQLNEVIYRFRKEIEGGTPAVAQWEEAYLFQPSVYLEWPVTFTRRSALQRIDEG